MRLQKLLQSTISIILAFLPLVGCSTPATPTPAPILPTSTPPLSPEVGHWEGEKPPVSFDILPDGNIQNFSITIPIAAGTCTIEAENVLIEDDNTFEVTYSVKKSDVDQNVWDFLYGSGPTPPVKMTDSVEMVELERVSGIFNEATVLTGAYTLWSCRGTSGQLFAPASEGKFNAVLKGP